MLRKSAIFLLLLIGCFQGVHAQTDFVRIDFADSLPKTRSDTSRIHLQLLYGQDQLLNRDPDSVLLLASALLRESRHLNYPFGIISSYYLLGRAYQALGIYDKSFSNYQAALPYFTGPHKKKLAQHYNDIGVMLTYAGDYREGANYFYKALAECQHNPTSTLKTAPIYNNLFSLWHALGDVDKALAYLDKAEATAIADNDSFTLGNVLNRQGGMRLGYNDTQARRYLEEAEQVSHACGDKRTEIQAQGNLAFLYALQGKGEAARKYLALSETTFRSHTPNIYARIEHLEHSGRVWQWLKDYTKAKKYLLEACALADSIRSPWYKKGSLEELGKLYAHTGHYKKAFRVQQEYARIHEALSNKERQQQLSWLDNKYQMAQQELEKAQRQLKLTAQKSSLKKQQTGILMGTVVLLLLIALYLTIRRNQKRALALHKQEHQALQQQRELEKAQALIEGEERERKRVALELHDGIGSMLSMAKLNLSVVQDTYSDRIEPPQAFREVLGLLDKSSQAIRNTAHYLMPEILLHGGLNEALSLFLSKIARSKNMDIRFHNFGEYPALSAEKERHIYRALQQVLEIILDSRRPVQLWIQLNWQDTLLYVTIEINPSESGYPPKPSTEWYALQESLKIADGVVYVDNGASDQNTIDIEFPL